MAKCEKCDTEIDNDASVEIRGVAEVVGYSTIDEFENEGVEWTPFNSWNEAWVCPKCKWYNRIWQNGRGKESIGQIERRALFTMWDSLSNDKKRVLELEKWCENEGKHSETYAEWAKEVYAEIDETVDWYQEMYALSAEEITELKEYLASVCGNALESMESPLGVLNIIIAECTKTIRGD